MVGTPAALRLHIDQLPESADSMVPAAVYGVIAESPGARFPIIAGSLAGAVHDHHPAVLLVAQAPGNFIERLEQTGFSRAHAALDLGQLLVYQLQEGFRKKMFRFGAEAFLTEFERLELPRSSLVVIDQADELLSLGDVNQAQAQAEVLVQWARRLNLTVLMFFTRVTSGSQAQNTLLQLVQDLSGLARLGSHGDGLEITFDYWKSAEGSIAARRHPLVTLPDGRYRAKPMLQVVRDAKLEGREVSVADPTATPRLLYCDPRFDVLTWTTRADYKRCADIPGMLNAAQGASQAIALLSFTRQSSVRGLAESVHHLRLSLGRAAHVVVVEHEASLRYANEVLLLRLGASLIVHQGVPENRLPLMLDALRGQVFTRDVGVDFEAALASVAAPAQRGYHAPADFQRDVAAALARAELLDLPCALFVARPAARQTCLELLAQLRFNRAGDLATTNGDHCLIFLSGCPTSSVADALRGIAGPTASSLFADEQVHGTREAIHQRLAQLAQETAGRTFPDTADGQVTTWVRDASAGLPPALPPTPQPAEAVVEALPTAVSAPVPTAPDVPVIATPPAKKSAGRTTARRKTAAPATMPIPFLDEPTANVAEIQSPELPLEPPPVEPPPAPAPAPTRRKAAARTKRRAQADTPANATHAASAPATAQVVPDSVAEPAPMAVDTYQSLAAAPAAAPTPATVTHEQAVAAVPGPAVAPVSHAAPSVEPRLEVPVASANEREPEVPAAVDPVSAARPDAPAIPSATMIAPQTPSAPAAEPAPLGAALLNRMRELLPTSRPASSPTAAAINAAGFARRTAYRVGPFIQPEAGAQTPSTQPGAPSPTTLAPAQRVHATTTPTPVASTPPAAPPPAFTTSEEQERLTEEAQSIMAEAEQFAASQIGSAELGGHHPHGLPLSEALPTAKADGLVPTSAVLRTLAPIPNKQLRRAVRKFGGE